MSKQPSTFLTACIDFFGGPASDPFLVAPGAKLAFGKEIKALTNDDRKEIAAGLLFNGYKIDPATIERKAT